MKQLIKIKKKRTPDEDANGKVKQAVKSSTREMAETVEGWIAELLLRKRSQSSSLPPLSNNFSHDT